MFNRDMNLKTTFLRSWRKMKNYVENQLWPDINDPIDESHNTKLHHAIQRGNEKEILELLKKGACVNITNINRVTPLHMAVQKGYPKLIDLLLEQGAWTEAENSNGLKPLHLIIESPKPMECLKVLLRFEGADVNGLDAKGNNLLHLVIDAPLPNHEKKDIIKVLIYEEIDLNAKNFEGETPLHKAAYLDNAELVSMLLKNGAKLEVKCKDLSPFDLAVEGKNINCIRVMIKHVIMRRLKCDQRVDENIMRKIQSNKDFELLYRQFEEEFNSLKLLRYNNFSSISYYEALFGKC